ncbi:potassium channel family protein [Actinotalea sp. Marseille-Q4924]|uniref:potassium channel family protein n=1 Tax=Actinotalea sp. Marseille-Q4924 TaxID=2866571 RepID=UPI001CE47C7C|nr:potassium channel family protein [Actinotalea sp. Marseille-Q4924]
MLRGLISVTGGLLIVLALRDVFHTLWHPTGQGGLSGVLSRVVWRVFRRRSPELRELAGPAAVAVIISTWLALVVAGGALTYWPHLPGSFSYSPGLSPGRGTELVDAVYLSLVTTATLGFGDIVPTTSWLRVLTPLQALISFALLTASATWVLQLYPALTRRRALAQRIANLRDAGLHEAIKGNDQAGARLIEGVAEGLAQVRVDLTQYAETFYFVEADPSINIACTVPYTYELAETAQRSDNREVRLAGTALARAADSLAMRLAEHLDTGQDDLPAVFTTYATRMGSCTSAGR